MAEERLEKTLSRELSALDLSERVLLTFSSCVKGSEAIFTARVMTDWKSDAYLLEPLKIVELLLMFVLAT
jgi:hypothetical protein